MSAATLTTPVTTRCAHCGDPCREAPREDEPNFCCAGCRTVYTLLRENGLQDFYRLDPRAGQRQGGGKLKDYDWLGTDELAATLARYRDEERWRVELELPAIHCIACVWLLERLPGLLPGVLRSTVDFTRRVATIDFDPRRTDLRAVAELLDRLGYPPVLRRARGERPAADRSLLYRIGVAGFCFGNIMLLSFPEYLGLGEDAGETIIGKVIGPGMLLLSLPVLCYAGAGFFRDARAGLRMRRITLDVPIAVGMLALFGRSVYEILSGAGPGYLDSFTGLVFFLLVGRWFQAYTFGRLSFDRDYHDYFPVGAYRLDADGLPQPVAATSLRAGDTIVVRPGQVIPADGNLAVGTRAGIDYSFVTGESKLRPTRGGDAVYAGGRAVDSALTVVVTKPTEESYLMGLWRDGHEKRREETGPPQRLVAAFTVGVLLIALASLAYWYPRDPATAYRAAVAVLIIACPCALALTAPFAYGSLQRLLGRTGYYLRSGATIDALAATDTFVFDKTGTLIEAETDGRLYWPDGEADGQAGIFLAMCRASTHPRSRAIATALTAEGVPPERIPPPEEVAGKGLRLTWHGTEYRVGSAAFCGRPDARPGTYGTANGRTVFRLDPPRPRLRPGVRSLLRELQARGEVYLLSGDARPADDFWEAFLPAERLHFAMSPFGKEAFVRELRERGGRVLMVGDGLNDTGALRAADAGLAVSEEDGAFSPASDAIVAADRLGRLPAVLTACRRLRGVTRAAYLLALAYNLVGLSYAVSGALSPVVAAILMPLSSVSVVAVACGGSYLLYRHDLDHRAG